MRVAFKSQPLRLEPLVLLPDRHQRVSLPSLPLLRAAGDVVQLRFGKNSTVETQPFGVRDLGQAWQFQLWAPNASAVDLVVIKPPTGPYPAFRPAPWKAGDRQLEQNREYSRVTMSPARNGLGFVATVAKKDFPKGPALYMYQLTYPDGRKSNLLPDPRSRYQPEDVHGPSQVMLGKLYDWQVKNFRPVTDKRQLILDEIHIGTLTQGGTFEAAIQKLDDIQAMGFNAVEIMPVKEFSGRWNWGYDMVGFFATENAYGAPNQFKHLIDEAHKRGLTVILDVVYNHVGPEGNYLNVFDNSFLRQAGTPWGEQFNWDNPQALAFVLDNLTMWLQEFNVDGFRFDMTNFIPDHALRAMTGHVQSIKQKAILIAEDGRDENHVTLPRESGLGFWAKWNFPWHHRIKGTALERVHENEPFGLAHLADVIEHGFRPHGSKMNHLFDALNYFESHDEVGNHDGQRTVTKISRERNALFSVLKYLVPGTPMNFMGEEHGERNPFYFFTDFQDHALQNAVRHCKPAQGRDSTDRGTFLASKLSDRSDTGMKNLTRDVMAFRKTVPALWEGGRDQMTIMGDYLGSDVLAIHRRGKEHPSDEVMIVLNASGFNYQLGNFGNYVAHGFGIQFPPGRWQEVLNSADAKYLGHGQTNAGRIIHGNGRDNQPIALAHEAVAIFRKSG